MKKFFLLLFCIICTTAVFAQRTNFQMTPDGLVNENDKKTYTIISAPGMKASELYNAFLVTIRLKCITNSTEMDVIEGKAINVYKLTGECYDWPGISAGCFYYYNILFKFKDEEIRVEPEIINYEYLISDTRRLHNFKSSILFKKNGKAEKEKGIQDINNEVNTRLSSIIDTALNIFKW